MKQTIVLVGASPLSYFLARELDNTLGNLAHTDLVWLTPDERTVHLPSTPSILDERTHSLPNRRFNDVRVRRQTIKSINLPARRIVTDKGVLDYDQLVIDSQPEYQLAELATIRRQLLTLFAGLKAQPKSLKANRARIYCQGDNAEAWQLALLIVSDLQRHYPSLVTVVNVAVDLPGNHLGDFLRRNGLVQATATTLKKPGLTIHPPTPIVAASKIRGLQVGKNGSALVTAQLHPHGFPEVTIVDGTELKQVNLLRVWRSIARQLGQELAAKLEGQQRSDLNIATPALILNGPGSSYAMLGDWENHRNRARLVARLDNHLRYRLAR